MFEVGFSEMLLLMLVALLVFGPERLPRVLREVALWIRKARAVLTSVQEEVSHELQMQDLHDLMKKKSGAEWLADMDHHSAATLPVLEAEVIERKADEPGSVANASNTLHEESQDSPQSSRGTPCE